MTVSFRMCLKKDGRAAGGGAGALAQGVSRIFIEKGGRDRCLYAEGVGGALIVTMSVCYLGIEV